MGRLAAAFSAAGPAATVLWCAVAGVVYQTTLRAGTREVPAACAQCETATGASEPNCEKYRPIATRLMHEAVRHAEAGRIDAASHLARRAARFPIHWSDEQSPEEFLLAISQPGQPHAVPVARVARRPVPTVPLPAPPPRAKPRAVPVPARPMNLTARTTAVREISRSPVTSPTPVARPTPHVPPKPTPNAVAETEPIAVSRVDSIPTNRPEPVAERDALPVLADRTDLETEAATQISFVGLPIPDDRQLACRAVEGRPAAEATLPPRKAAGPVFDGFIEANDIDSPRRVDDADATYAVKQAASEASLAVAPEAESRESTPPVATDQRGIVQIADQTAFEEPLVVAPEAVSNESTIPQAIDISSFVRPAPLSVRARPESEPPVPSPRRRAYSANGSASLIENPSDRSQDEADWGRVSISDLE